jgi:hypothetical protein
MSAAGFIVGLLVAVGGLTFAMTAPRLARLSTHRWSRSDIGRRIGRTPSEAGYRWSFRVVGVLLALAGLASVVGSFFRG